MFASSGLWDVVFPKVSCSVQEEQHFLETLDIQQQFLSQLKNRRAKLKEELKWEPPLPELPLRKEQVQERLNDWEQQEKWHRADYEILPQRDCD